MYEVGDSLADVHELDSLPARPTLLIFMTTWCSACRRSAGFYARLLDSHETPARALRVVVISNEAPSTVRLFLESDGIAPDNVLSIHADSAFTPTTVPSLFLLDSSRRVAAVWPGPLSPAQEREVTAYVVGGLRSRGRADAESGHRDQGT